GYQVFVVVDASGTFNKSVRDAAIMRMSQAGAVPVNWFAVACELAQDWRHDMEGLARLLGDHLPSYKNLITSYSALTAKRRSAPATAVSRRPCQGAVGHDVRRASRPHPPWRAAHDAGPGKPLCDRPGCEGRPDPDRRLRRAGPDALPRPADNGYRA